MPADHAAAAILYPARHAVLTGKANALHIQLRNYRVALALTFALILVLAVVSMRGAGTAWPVAFPALIAVLVLARYFRLLHKQSRTARLLTLYTAALARLDGTQPQSGHTGEAFHPPAHLYDRDLAILGSDSLFGLLCTVRTGVGQRGLARDLLSPHNPDATLARQQATQELTPHNDLREQIHLLGVSQFQQVPAAFFDDWLAGQPPTFHAAFRYLLFATTAAILALLLSGLAHLLPWSTVTPNLLAVFALQAALALYLRPRVVPILTAATHLANQTRMFRDGLALLQAIPFDAPKLRALQAQSQAPADAVPLLNGLHGQLIIVEQRNSNWFLLASLLLCAGTHAALSIAGWKRRHAAAMKQWLATWAEFESLNALATYAFEHPENTYPEILPPGAAIFEATALAHPLLPADAVANDIALNPTQSLYLISGSNMAGKSTLLRAIGLNAVLAAAGAPIRATRARLSPFTVGASLALTDSLAEGKSKFLAEVERLHAILQLPGDATPVLFLIDEIFSGTNSLDRRAAAEAVARALVARGGIGALSTHDLTLTEMAANPALRAVNLHMASPDPADPLAFDYRLKPGVNPTSNALAILRLIGIHVEV